MSSSAASSSAAAAAIAAESIPAQAKAASSVDSESAASNAAVSDPASAAASAIQLQAERNSMRADGQWMRAHIADLSAAAAAASASPSTGLAALADAFFEIDEFVAAHATTTAAAASQEPHSSRSRMQQLPPQPPAPQLNSASTDAIEAQRLELSALLDAWRLRPSSVSPPTAVTAASVLHPSAVASLSRSVRSQLAAHFLERLSVAGSDADLHAELTNIIAQILPQSQAAQQQLQGGAVALSAAQSQLCSSLSRQLHSHILPSISAFEWSRQRDLPPILSKAITRPSPAVFLVQSFLSGVLSDAQRGLTPALARPVLQGLMVDAAESVTEIYTSLGSTVSRFHSRQMFVDVTSMFVVLRSVQRTISQGTNKREEHAGPSQQQQLHLDPVSADQLCRVHIALLELACAVVIAHPTLLPLAAFPALLAEWEKAWIEQRAGASQNAKTHASVSAAESLVAIDALLSRHLGMLWHCEPAFVAAVAPLSAALGAAPSPPSFLSSFFAMPRLHLAGSDDASAAASAAGIAADTQCVSQNLNLGPACVPAEMLASPIVVASIPPARLLRLVQMRHQLREGDFPALDADEEAAAAQLRSHCARLHAPAAFVSSPL